MAACACVCAARVRVADVGGEEFDVTPAGLVARTGDQRRHYHRCRPWWWWARLPELGGELVGHRIDLKMLPGGTPARLLWAQRHFGRERVAIRAGRATHDAVLVVAGEPGGGFP